MRNIYGVSCATNYCRVPPISRKLRHATKWRNLRTRFWWRKSVFYAQVNCHQHNSSRYCATFYGASCATNLWPSSADFTKVTPRPKMAQAWKLRYKNVATCALNFDGASQYFIARVKQLPSTVFCVGYIAYAIPEAATTVQCFPKYVSFFLSAETRHINQLMVSSTFCFEKKNHTFLRK